MRIIISDNCMAKLTQRKTYYLLLALAKDPTFQPLVPPPPKIPQKLLHLQGRACHKHGPFVVAHTEATHIGDLIEPNC